MSESSPAAAGRSYLPELPLSSILEAGWNPRKQFDPIGLQELAASIAQKGIIEPILVRPLVKKPKGWKGGDAFEVVAGARRVRAAKLAGLEVVPAMSAVLDDVEALELAVIENQQRADVNPIEEAEGYAALQAADPKRFTPAVIAARVGKRERYVHSRLRLLGLETPLRAALLEGRLSVGHGELLLRLTPALRKYATDPDNGDEVVWRMPDMFDREAEKKWVPQAADLLPLARLEAFIREKSVPDLKAPEARFLVEESVASDVAEKVAAGSPDGFAETEEVEQALSSLVALSDDPQVRSRVGAKKGEPVPLSPSQWREARTKVCEFTTTGVIVHGGPQRLIPVCLKKTCPMHWPDKVKAAKAKAAGKKPGKGADKPAKRPAWEVQRERERRELEQWRGFLEVLRPAFAKHQASRVKFGPGLVRAVLGAGSVRGVKKDWGVELTKKTAALVLLLHNVTDYDRSLFLQSTKGLGFNFGAVEQKFKAAQKRAEAEQRKAQQAAAGGPSAKA